MLAFKDIFKSGFLSSTGGVTSDPALMTVACALIVAFAILVKIVYRKTYKGVMYSSSFGSALSLVVLVTGFVIMTISSNVILSLGMVGALSIVRFRTAVKDAMDIAYMFWAVGLGIAAGAGLFILSMLLFVVVALFLMLTEKETLFSQPYLFIFSCIKETQEEEAMRLLTYAVRKSRIRGKTVTGSHREISVEVSLKKTGNTDFVSRIAAIEGVTNASLIACDGDITI